MRRLADVRPGHVFDFKPSLALPQSKPKVKDAVEKNRTVQIGDAILVGEREVIRLGTRPLAPIATYD